MNMQHANTAPSMTTAWSPGTMIERFDGDDGLVRELVGLFVTDCPRQLQEVRVAIAGADAEALRKAAHAFNGAISNFAAAEPTRLVQALEQHGRCERLREASVTLQQLEPQLQALLSSMRAFLEEPVAA